MVEQLHKGKMMIGAEEMPTVRKPFVAPELQVYGRARDITRSAGNTRLANSDGGGQPNDKTR
jgi:hypothetical protein